MLSLAQLVAFGSDNPKVPPIRIRGPLSYPTVKNYLKLHLLALDATKHSKVKLVRFNNNASRVIKILDS